MHTRELLREAVVLGVDDEIDIALVVQSDVLGAMARNRRQTHALEQPPQLFGVGRGVFDELETVGVHGVFGAQLSAHGDTTALS